MIKNPNWEEATSWLFTIVAKDLNSRTTKNKSSKVARARLKPTQDRQIASPMR